MNWDHKKNKYKIVLVGHKDEVHPLTPSGGARHHESNSMGELWVIAREALDWERCKMVVFYERRGKNFGRPIELMKPEDYIYCMGTGRDPMPYSIRERLSEGGKY